MRKESEKEESRKGRIRKERDKEENREKGEVTAV